MRRQILSDLRRDEEPRFLVQNPHPPSITSSPWYNFTMQLQVIKNDFLTINDLYNYVRNHWIPFPPNRRVKNVPTMGFRIIRISTWCRTNDVAFELGIYPFLNNSSWGRYNPDSSILKPMWTKTAYPAYNQFARIAFVWPKSHQEFVFYDRIKELRDVPIASFSFENAIEKVNLLVNLSIMWTLDTVVPFPDPIELGQLHCLEWPSQTEAHAKDDAQYMLMK